MKRLFSILLVLCLTLTFPAFAADAPSPWAESEVAEALERDLVPDELQSAYTSKITRSEFARVALYYCAAAQRLSIGDFRSFYHSRTEEFSGKPYTSESPFTDTDDFYIKDAYTLGIVNGRGDGTFDPDSFISRQEAAVMLANAYRSMGGSAVLAEGTADFEATFSDSEALASWALESAALMYQCGVMNGTGPDAFDPLGSYTREQCYATFLRLFHYAPAERILFTYEDGLDQIFWGPKLHVLDELHTETFSVYYGSMGGLPHGDSFCGLWILYRSGGRQVILNGWSAEPTDPRYHMDGNFYDLTLSDDEAALTLKRGFEGETYTYAVDIMSGKITEL